MPSHSSRSKNYPRSGNTALTIYVLVSWTAKQIFNKLPINERLRTSVNFRRVAGKALLHAAAAVGHFHTGAVGRIGVLATIISGRTGKIRVAHAAVKASFEIRAKTDIQPIWKLARGRSFIRVFNLPKWRIIIGWRGNRATVTNARFGFGFGFCVLTDAAPANRKTVRS